MTIKTEFEFIRFVEKSNYGRTTLIWSCRNKKSDDFLGLVVWSTGWRQYVFQPSRLAATEFSAGCLMDMASFLNSCLHVRKKERAVKSTD